jgi:hypothetical protein
MDGLPGDGSSFLTLRQFSASAEPGARGAADSALFLHQLPTSNLMERQI